MTTIETLHRAAAAAGYAMAAPDDDEAATVLAPQRAPSAPGRELAIVPSPRVARASLGDTLTVASTWVRGYLPVSFGGRATA